MRLPANPGLVTIALRDRAAVVNSDHYGYGSHSDPYTGETVMAIISPRSVFNKVPPMYPNVLIPPR